MKTTLNFLPGRWWRHVLLAAILGLTGQNLLGNDYDSFLVARYNFENTNSPYADSSGNNNNPNEFPSGSPADTFSTNAAEGQYARLYFGQTGFQFDQSDPAYNHLSNALSGNFSVTGWVKTTNSVGNDFDNAYYGAPIFFSGSDFNNHCTIPLTITGSKAGFSIISSDGPGTVTIHSTTSVNDGQYHFLAVTRRQSSGLMSVYVDGNLEATDTGITNPVITEGWINIATGPNNFSGLMDDVRIYSTNLSAGDVANISSIGNIVTLAKAIGTTNLPTSTSGDSNWFVESTNTYNGAPYAAQSGSITTDESSTLSVTVTGPGSLTFYWSSQDGCDDFDYEFAIDGNDTNDIYCSQDWVQAGPYAIPAGQHVLSWTTYAADNPNEAGFLDNVSFVPAPPPAPPTGNWTNTGAIPTSERFAFPLTVLRNGEVLASGGQAVFSITTYFESDLYNPTNGTWQETGFMNFARQNHTTTLLTNGLVLAAGGITAGSGGGPLATCELYSQGTALWTNCASMKMARYGHTAVVLTNGFVLVTGGISNSVTWATSELFNPGAGTWTLTGNLNSPRAFASAFLLTNGTVLVVGGQGTNSTILASAEIYNPGTGLWHTASPMLMAHNQPICQLLPNGQVLVAGGLTNGIVSGFSELYDPASDSWSQTGPMNKPRETAGSVLLNNGIVLVAGGSNGNSLTNAELFDPAGGFWTVTGAMLEGRNGPFPMVLLANGKALATGGIPVNNDLSTGTTELYTTTLATILLAKPTKLAGGGFQFSFAYTPGASTTVFSTTNVALPFANWTSLGSATEVSSGQFQFTDPQASSNAKRFYRVSSP